MTNEPELNTHVEPKNQPVTRSISRLTSDVVDQIAAGEVVERPAHLIKELVENSIDAGATAVEVEYDQAGRRVRVTDDGGGIGTADLELALARHATSKIVSADELWNLASFGFRGEALASIAAVSRLSLQSRPKNQMSAQLITSEFGRLSEVQPTSGNFGTSVQIEELFSNVPARLKFMKSEAAEVTQIKATLRALALSHEAVEFRIKSKGRIEQIWPRAKNWLERAKQVLGTDQLYEATGEFQAPGEPTAVKAQIVFAGPHDVTGNARSIMTFVQNRWVQDRGLQAAVIEAFRGLLMHGEFPIAVVRLQVAKDDVDVNIHPTKSQIKFRDSQSAFRAVNRTLRAALEQAPWLKRADQSRSLAQPSAQAQPSATMAHVESRKYSVADLTRSVAALELPSTAAETLATAPLNSIGRFQAAEFDAVVFKSKEDFSPSGQAKLLPSGAWSRLQVIGQLNLTYIVAQDSDRMYLIDQHAAHERVAYERLMRSWTAGDVSVQNLLIPLTVDLEADGASSLTAIASELRNLGVVLDQIAPQTVAVRARPALISDAAIRATLIQLARELFEHGGSFVLEKKISDLCATMACHSVVRAGQALSAEQMKNLLVQMDEFSLSSFCPHGRPVSVEWRFEQIERDFGRIV